MKLTLKWGCLSVGGVALVLLILAAAAGAGRGSGAAATPAAAAQVAQPMTTATPTARPPTAVPTPPKPKASEEAKAYMREVASQMTEMQKGLNGLTEQSTLAGSNPALIMNKDWQLRTALALVILEQAAKSINGYRSVPAEMAEFHGLMQDVASDMLYIVTEYTAGVDGVNARRLENAASRMNMQPRKLQNCLAEMKKLQAEYEW